MPSASGEIQHPCTVPPPGWSCSRPAGHDGPCAAIEGDSPHRCAMEACGEQPVMDVTLVTYQRNHYLSLVNPERRVVALCEKHGAGF